MSTRLKVFIVAAIVVVAAFLVYRMSVSNDDARTFIVNQDLVQIKTAMNLYRDKHGEFPGSADWMEKLVAEGFIDKKKRDPWGEYYVYLKDSGLILSYGLDKKKGGVDMGEDRVISLSD